VHILSRLNETVDRVENAYRIYAFPEVAQGLYEFFWSDFCDWYLEAAKTELKRDQASAACLTVMDHIMAAVLKLLHPFMPHITEELWHRMGFGSGSIQFASLNDLRVGVTLDAAEIAFAKQVYVSTTIARNLRADYRIPSNKRTRLILKPAEPSRDFAVFARLSNAEPFEVNPNFVAEPGVPVAVTPLGQVYMPLEGLVDFAAERERLAKEMAKLEAELATVRKKLANESFVSRAPAAVVAEHRRRESDFLRKLEQLRERVA
jgi:valyl-tRNA synthetase